MVRRLTSNGIGGIKKTMTTDTYLILGTWITLVAFLWNLHRDMVDLRERLSDLRERIARLEGLFEGFTHRDKQETAQ